MNQGEIQAIGKHESLILRNELYASLCRLQNIEPEPAYITAPTPAEERQATDEISTTTVEEPAETSTENSNADLEK